MEEKPLGGYIFEQVRKFQKEIENKLTKISVNGEEWAVNADYSFQFSPEKKIRDCFTVIINSYINDKRQGTYEFKFKSIETIFLNEICEVMYKVILDPNKSEEIIEESKVSIEYSKLKLY